MNKRLTPVEQPAPPRGGETTSSSSPAPQNDGASHHAADGVLYGLLPDAASHAAPQREGAAVVFLPNPAPANDEALDLPSDEEIAAELAADPEFAEVCAARRARWLDALETYTHDDDDDAHQLADDAGPHTAVAAAPPHAEGHDDDDCT